MPYDSPLPANYRDIRQLELDAGRKTTHWRESRGVFRLDDGTVPINFLQARRFLRTNSAGQINQSYVNTRKA